MRAATRSATCGCMRAVDMIISTTSRVLLPMLVAAAMAACGGGSGGPPPPPPMISNLALNQTSVAQGSGTVSIPGSLQFTDPAGNLSTFTVTVLDASGNQVSTSTTQLQGTGGKTSGTLDGMVQFVVGAPAVFTIKVYVTDADGANSNTLSTQFQVVAAASMAPVVTAIGPSPSSLTVSNGTLYWLESGEDALKSVAVAGGTAQVVATRMVNPISMAFSGSDVVWTDFRRSAGAPCPGATPDVVLKRTSASGVTTVVTSGGTCGVGTANIAVIGTTLYWTSSDPSQETLNATPLGGGTTTTLATSTLGFSQIVASGGRVYWLESSPAANSMSAIRSVPGGGGPITTVVSGFNAGVARFAVDAVNVYYTVPAGPNAVGLVDLVAMPLAGGAATTLASAIWPPLKLIATGANVVWINQIQQVWSISVAGGSPVSLATSPGGGPYDVAFDGTNVVWTDASGIATPAQQGAVRAVPPTGGMVTTLYQSSDLPQELAIDPASRINWIESDGRGLARIARLGAGNVPQTVADGISSSPPTFVVVNGALIFPDLYRLKSIQLSGGLPSTLVVDTWPIGNLATDGTSLVWNDARNGTLRKAPVAGGTVTVLADTAALGAFIGAPGAVRIGPNGSAYWIVSVSPGPGQPGTPSVVGAPVAAPTTMVTAIAPNLPDATDLAVDATGVYIAEALGVGPSIVRAALNGGGALTTVVSNPVGPRMLALDGPTLYWMDGFEIAKIPTAGGTALGVLDFDLGTVGGGFAFDSTSVYFTVPSLQDIRRTPK
jgi:hypothetical protein